MESRVADLGSPVHFIDFGGAGTAMVLVHGLGGAAINWLAVGPLLARRGRVLALDLAGFGRTPPAGPSADLETQRDVLDRFLRLVVGGPAIVVGNSMGGLVALMEAASAPDRVTALVLVAPAQPAPLEARLDLEVITAFTAYSMPWLGPWYLRRRATRLGPEGQVREMLRICCVDPTRVAADLRAAHVALAAERLDRMPWATAAFLEAARSTLAGLRRKARFHEMVANVRSPALLVQGTGDRLVPLAASRQLARRRPDWTLAVLDDVGHVPQMEDPDRFAKVIESWLDSGVLASRPRPPL